MDYLFYMVNWEFFEWLFDCVFFFDSGLEIIMQAWEGTLTLLMLLIFKVVNDSARFLGLFEYNLLLP